MEEKKYRKRNYNSRLILRNVFDTYSHDHTYL